jgi:hypothetical protein
MAYLVPSDERRQSYCSDCYQTRGIWAIRPHEPEGCVYFAGFRLSRSARRRPGWRAELIRRGALPKKATVDAFHIGIAAAHQIDYLLTWNW